MSFEMLAPSSREEWLSIRRETIGASEVASLLGIHPWKTAFQLYAEKSGLLAPDTEENGAMRRGRLLEDVAVRMLREERPEWSVTANTIPGGLIYRDVDIGLSCTPDTFLVAPGREGRGVGQIKSVHAKSFRESWRNADGEIEPPLYVAVQALQEAFLTGAKWAVAIALVIDFGIDLHVVEVPMHVGMTNKLREASLDFWDRVKEKRPPDIAFDRDSGVVRALFATDTGETIDLSGNNRVMEILSLRDALKAREADGSAAEKERKALDAEIIAMLGGAAYGRLGDGRLISAKTINRKSYTVAASSYRSVSVRSAA